MAKHTVKNHHTRQCLHSIELQRAHNKKILIQQQQKYSILGWVIAAILGPGMLGVSYSLHAMGIL